MGKRASRRNTVVGGISSGIVVLDALDEESARNAACVALAVAARSASSACRVVSAAHLSAHLRAPSALGHPAPGRRAIACFFPNNYLSISAPGPRPACDARVCTESVARWRSAATLVFAASVHHSVHGSA